MKQKTLQELFLQISECYFFPNLFETDAFWNTEKIETSFLILLFIYATNPPTEKNNEINVPFFFYKNLCITI